MKISPELLAELRAAILPYQPLGDENTRQRWDLLWRAVDAKRFDVTKFYKAGLNDNHIDTALRHAVRKEG